MWIRVRSPVPASSCAVARSSASAVVSTGRGSDRNRLLARSMAMMSSCLVIAQNGRYGGLSTQATGLFARSSARAVCNRSSSAYAVGSASTLAASSIVRELMDLLESGLDWELDGCQVPSLRDRHTPDPGFRPESLRSVSFVQPGTARSLRVVLLVVMA